jgi:predicted RNase H-like HicB family nuclease
MWPGKGWLDVMKTYQVKYERHEEGCWNASVSGIRGCSTQGRTIHEARRRIRAALGEWVTHAEKAMLVDEVKLPAHVRRLLGKVQETRERAETEQARAAAVARMAVKKLRRDLGLSVRDAGALLGISGQRVHQLEVDRRH